MSKSKSQSEVYWKDELQRLLSILSNNDRDEESSPEEDKPIKEDK